MFIGTAATAAATTFNLTWLPEYIVLVCDAVADATGLKVTVLGEGVICDLDNPGLDSLTGIRDVSALGVKLKLVLADGVVLGKNVEIIVTNGDATETIAVYGFGDNKGENYVKSLRQTVLANSGETFTKFAFLGIPAMGADDEMNISFVDGLTHKYDTVDLIARLGMTQAMIALPALDNMDGIVDSVNFIPSADRVAYLVKFEPVVGA